MLQIFEQACEFFNSYKQKNFWAVIETKKEGNDLILVYQYDEWSDIFINDKTTHLNFQKYFKVTTGLWREDFGYWYAIKRIEKAIRCKNVYDIQENKFKKEKWSFELTKKIFTVSKEVAVNCPNGVLNFKCTDAEITEHFNIGLYSMAEEKFILCTEDCDGSSNYIRKLEGGEPIQKFNLDEFRMLDFESNSE